ncbi:oligosaccharide biosynthesis protein Alg14 like-domain-containing protein [Dactylonectria estremocensis]|uniref:UDP-N-acetylglucosamine transferase subunit ALG14 n=1 Tax=Dactylonectria estremocensis TaxID=1079267 RepID=A0A9P9E834_9HYPO|nr:oligosaccharide biosynthesis protein Alg14 like-domain-containing protein [Dactylonectria estremocensis]
MQMSKTQPGAGLAILVKPLISAIAIGTFSVLAFPTWTALISTYLLLLIGLCIFMTTRQIELVRRRAEPATKQGRRDDTLDYFLFVLGSGGHTKEMLMMMDDGYCGFQNAHRRYLVSSGDRMSNHHLEEYETGLVALCKAKDLDPGTFDLSVVTRARNVHQSIWSTPLTGLLSILDIFLVLLTPPDNRIGAELRYPTQIFSNGPATGFFVALAVHLLKVFYIVPENAMSFIYIESWARISTLSLTGKLLHHTGLADIFMVQHPEVAAKYKVVNGGEMVFNSRQP